MLLRRGVRKIAYIALILFSVFLSGIGCHAESKTDGGNHEIKPLYETAAYVDVNFKISESGVAGMQCALKPRGGANLDKVTFNMIIAKIDGTIVYNKTFVVSYKSLTEEYVVQDAFKLTRHGNYQLRATAQCYKKGGIVETIKAPIVKGKY